MKKSLFTLFTITLFYISANAQNIWRCNNDPHVTLSPNVFRTLQEAHNAASNGDIIYVEPSYAGASYGTLTCLKTLKIIGNGYYHTENTSIVQPEKMLPSIVNDISIVAGNGTILSGLNINITTVGSQLIIKAQNVTVTRCYINIKTHLMRLSPTENASGAIFSHNYFGTGWGFIESTGYSDYNGSTCLYTPYPVENVVFKNNINPNFSTMRTIPSGGSGTPPCNPLIQIPAAKNWTISNNSNVNQLRYCENCTVQSNIFLSPPAEGIHLYCPGTAASHNVCTATPCVQGTNNVNSANVATVFVGTVGAHQPDKNSILPNSSPAKAAGFGGVDAGAFGTTDPYRLSGLAPIPQITSYSRNSSAGVYTSSTPMTVTISVRGNN